MKIGTIIVGLFLMASSAFAADLDLSASLKVTENRSEILATKMVESTLWKTANKLCKKEGFSNALLENDKIIIKNMISQFDGEQYIVGLAKFSCL